MTQRDDEKTDPTHERQIKERMYETEDGAWVREFPTCKHVLVDMGYIDDQQEYALDQYALMHYVGTRHTAPKAVQVSEMGRELGITIDDVPTLRDGYRYCVRNLSHSDLRTVEMVVADLTVNENVFAIRKAMTQLHGEIDRAATNLAKAVSNFNDERKHLQERAPTC